MCIQQLVWTMWIYCIINYCTHTTICMLHGITVHTRTFEHNMHVAPMSNSKHFRSGIWMLLCEYICEVCRKKHNLYRNNWIFRISPHTQTDETYTSNHNINTFVRRNLICMNHIYINIYIMTGPIKARELRVFRGIYNKPKRCNSILTITSTLCLHAHIYSIYLEPSAAETIGQAQSQYK